MSILIYTSDLRDQDGETTEALRLADDYIDVRTAANDIDWRNVKEWSLDQFHLELVQAQNTQEDFDQKHLKHFNGDVGRTKKSLPAVLTPDFATLLASCRFPVTSGDGVFISATASWIPGGGEGALTDHVGAAAETRIKLERLGGSPGGPAGTTRKAHTHQAYGGLGVVWAYRVESGSLDYNVIALRGSCAYGSNYTAKPTGAQLTVFVVNT